MCGLLFYFVWSETSVMTKWTYTFTRVGHDVMRTVWVWSLALQLLYSIRPCDSVSIIEGSIIVRFSRIIVAHAGRFHYIG